MFSEQDLRSMMTTDLQPVRQFLGNSLRLKAQNDTTHYDHLVDQLKARDDPETLWRVYLGLQSCLSVLMKDPDNYRELINALYSYNWQMEKKINIAFLHLLSTFVSANSIFLLPTFQMTIKSLVQLPNTFGLVTSTGITVTAPPLSIQPLSELTTQLHDLLKYVVTTVPTGLAELLPVLISNFPYKKQPIEILTNYVKQMLFICEYLPVMQPKILEIIIDKCLEIDVEIYIEDTGEVMIQKIRDAENDNQSSDNDNNDQHDGSDRGVFEIDIDSQQQHDITNAPFTETNQHIAAEVSDSAEKLDAMLVLIIEFINKQLQNYNGEGINATVGGSSSSSSSSVRSSSNVVDESNGDRLFCQLVAIFEDKVLLAHRSKFVQFIMFYICSKLEKYAVLFTKKLAQMFMDDKNSLWKRQCSMVYLASYCARAHYVPLGLIRDVLFQLIEWANSYVISSRTSQLPVDDEQSQNIPRYLQHDSESLGVVYSADDLDEFGRLKATSSIEYSSSSSTYTNEQKGKHETFFCCVQAACYIVCFHGIDMAISQKSDKLVKNRWERVITSKLIPLNFCLCSVRFEFLRLANHTELLREEVWKLLPTDIKNYQNDDEVGKNTKAEVVAISIMVPGARPKPPKTISAMAGQVLKGAKANPLDSFFPFDPCLLRMLYTYLERDYRPWQGLPGIDLDNEMNGGEFTDYDDLSLDYDVDDGNDMDTSSIYSKSSGTSLASSLQLANGKQEFGSYMSDGMYVDGTEDGSDYDDEHESVYANGVGSGNDTSISGNAMSSSHASSSASGPIANGVAFLPIRKPRAFSISSTGSW